MTFYYEFSNKTAFVVNAATKQAAVRILTNQYALPVKERDLQLHTGKTLFGGPRENVIFVGVS